MKLLWAEVPGNLFEDTHFCQKEVVPGLREESEWGRKVTTEEHL